MESETKFALKALVEALDNKIEFHRRNKNDPYGIGNAVKTTLEEVKAAVVEAISAL